MSKVQDSGGPAFPEKRPTFKAGYRTSEMESVPGMTLRDYFAAKAMQGICASGPTSDWTDERIAHDAYALADAMLKARQS